MKLRRFAFACAAGAAPARASQATSAAGNVRASRFMSACSTVPLRGPPAPPFEGNNDVFDRSRQTVEYPAPVLVSGRMLGVALLAALVSAVPATAATPRKAPAKLRALPEPRLPSTYLLTPTDQLGFPGQKPGTLVTPEGDLYTGWGELTF